MSTLLEHSDADVKIEERPDGKRCIKITPRGRDIYIHNESCVTSYPEELIRFMLDIKGPSYLCDEISRDTDQTYVRKHLELTITAHLDPGEFSGKSVLDFGCGSGASTVILSGLFPETNIVGIELEPDLLEIARRRIELYGLENVRFLSSPSSDAIPEDLGMFDIVVLSAVYEHLLPEERKSLLPRIWRHIKPGGVLFVDETPHRWFPIETHTTGAPLINYLPNRLALLMARRFSKRIDKTDEWGSLLRKGIRGGTVSEIMSNLKVNGHHDPALLKPDRIGIRDWVDLWYEGYAASAEGKYSSFKKSSRLVFKVFHKITGIIFVPYLSLAIKKN